MPRDLNVGVVSDANEARAAIRELFDYLIDEDGYGIDDLLTFAQDAVNDAFKE